MIPIKEAINIFEQCKIDWLRGFVLPDQQFGVETQLQAHFHNDHKIMGKSLLSHEKIKYFKKTKDGLESIFGEGLQLYGKNLEFSKEGYLYNELKYEKIYRTVYDIEELNVLDLFENYDYQEMYNPSINYTVMGYRENNIILYVDISVDNKEFKDFLNSLFTKEEKNNG